VSYLISLLKKIALNSPFQGQLITSMPLQPTFQEAKKVKEIKTLPHGFNQLDDDVRDLLKTIQIQLCMKQNELSPKTVKKLMILH
jgi:hypothetical protein